MAFTAPWILWLLPLAFLPLVLQQTTGRVYSWVALLPQDPLSDLMGILLKALAVLALVFILLGLAGLHSQQQQIERIGKGAQIVLVLDRSASMDDAFSSGSDGGIGETKSVAASRIIRNFVNSRQNDMYGMITFSNSAMHVLPLTENRTAVIAAVQATAGNSLLQTNIGSGLTSGAGLFNNVPDSGSRVVILLSDGGGRLAASQQEKIRDWYDRLHISLYWIVLRQPGGLSIFDSSYKPPESGALPAVIELNDFFKTLRSPFHAYEAENPQSLTFAIADINRKEKKPIRYHEQIPGRDYTVYCYLLAALMIAVLLSVKLLEVRAWQ